MNQILIKAAVLVFLMIPATGAYHYAQHIDGKGSRWASVSDCETNPDQLSDPSSRGLSTTEMASVYDELDAAGDGDIERALMVVETQMLQEMNLLDENFAEKKSRSTMAPYDYRPTIIWLTILASLLGMIPLFYVCSKLDERGYKTRMRSTHTRAQVALQMSIARHNSHIS